jgi:hypothetical protein
MGSNLIETYLENLKKQNTFDGGFIDILIESNRSGEDGETTANKIIKLISERYAKSKKDKA